MRMPGNQTCQPRGFESFYTGPHEPAGMTAVPLFDAALLELLFDHPVQIAADSLDIQTLDQRLLLLDTVHRAFQDVSRVEAGRERAWRKVLERRHELEDLLHHPVGRADVVELPVPEGVGGEVGSLKRVLHQVEDLLQAKR